VLFDPQYSHKGVLFAVSKAPRKKNVDEEELNMPIFTPEDEPEFGERGFDRPRKEFKLNEKPKKDWSKAARKPEQPQVGFGSKGNIGTSLTGDLMKGLIHKDKEEKSRDPREAILSYAEKAKST